jgi:hypothetical protein
MTVITMSRTELSRLRVMIDLADGRTRVEDAAALMGLQRRQIYRLLDAFRAHGPDALIQAPWQAQQSRRCCQVDDGRRRKPLPHDLAHAAAVAQCPLIHSADNDVPVRGASDY